MRTRQLSVAFVCGWCLCTVAIAQDTVQAGASDVDQAFARAMRDDTAAPVPPAPVAPARPAAAAADAASVPGDGAREPSRDEPAATPRPRSGLTLETTSVSGNRELPKVMVIVPWKNAQPVELGGRPLSSLVEEALTPIDREVFQRELDYYGLLHGEQRDDAQ